MISEELQDQAALFVLGALDARESAAFEKDLAVNPELRAIVREFREAAADLGRTAPAQVPPAELKRRVLSEIALAEQGRFSARSATFTWLPWAIAAGLVLFCGALALDRTRLQRELAAARASDPFGQTTFVTLTSPKGEHPDAKVTIAWQADRQSGMITIHDMPPADSGADYQLWAIDTAHKDPVNAGIVHVDSSGVARIRFKPDQHVAQIKAFAISLERAGGVPKREGPIVMLGSA